MSLTEQELLQGWLNENYKKPTPKEFCSDAVGVGTKDIGSREAQFTFLVNEVFLLKETGLSQATIAARTAIDPIIVDFILRRASRRNAATSLYSLELNGEHGSQPLESVERFFKLAPGDITLDWHARKVHYDGRVAVLGTRERVIMRKLVATLGRYCGMVELMAAYYEGKNLPSSGCTYLRKHLKLLQTDLVYLGLGIYAVRGAGFRLGTLE